MVRDFTIVISNSVQEEDLHSGEGVVEKVYIPGAASSAAENTEVAPVVSERPRNPKINVATLRGVLVICMERFDP